MTLATFPFSRYKEIAICLKFNDDICRAWKLTSCMTKHKNMLSRIADVMRSLSYYY